MSKASRKAGLNQYLGALGRTVPATLIALVLAIAAAAAALSWFSADERQAVITGALIFLVLQSYALYGLVTTAADQINEIATGTRSCKIIVAPTHATLTRTGDKWESNGVLSLVLLCDGGSTVKVTLVTPSGADIRWKYRDVTPHLWNLVGTDADGLTTWDVEVPRAEAVTHLGQFAVTTADCERSARIDVKAAGKTPDGFAIEHDVQIGLIPVVRDDEPMSPVPSARNTPA